MMTETRLCEAATAAMNHAYVPYSGYRVGAALLTKSGRIYTGCNIENASYTPTVCAERTAVFKAVSEGERDFIMLAVCGGKEGMITGAFPPCGVCRQVLAEFCPPEFPVLMLTGENTYRKVTLAELLPMGFGPSFLQQKKGPDSFRGE